MNKKEHCLGLAYASAAILRVKALSGILFENAFDFDRFKRVDSRDRDLDYSYYIIEQENCFCCFTSHSATPRLPSNISRTRKYVHVFWSG